MSEFEEYKPAPPPPTRPLIYMVRIVVCVLILGAGIFAMKMLQSLKPTPKQKPREELIKTLISKPVKLQDIRAKITGYGTVRPIREIQIGSEVKGKVVYVNPKLDEGSLVKKGTVVVKIDKADYVINLAEANAEVKRLIGEKAILKQFITDTEKELAAIQKILALEYDDYKRTLDLFRKKVKYEAHMDRAQQTLQERYKAYITSRASVDKAKLQLDTTNAQIDKAKSQRDMAELSIERCVVKAPFNARIVKLPIEDGEYVNMGSELMTLADDSNVELPVSLDAYDAAKILDLQTEKHNGYRHWLKTPKNINVDIYWAENPKQCAWKGKIDRIEKFDPDTRTVTFVVIPTAPLCKKANSFPLVSGMFCKAVFYGRVLKNAMKVPWVSVQLDGNVFTVDKNGIMHDRKVAIFSSEEDHVIISSGLPEGEYVVTQSIPRGIVNGSKVKPYDPQKTAEQLDGEKPEAPDTKHHIRLIKPM